MAKTGSEDRRASRQKVLTRGLAAGALAFGVPALANAWIARRAARIRRTADPGSWRRVAADVDGVRVSLLRLDGSRSGSTPTLFLHSLGPGHSVLQWATVAEALSSDRTVVLMDLPGWGESERADVDYGWRHAAETVLSVLHDEIGTPCHLVAGGESAAVALSLPEIGGAGYLRSLALSGPSGVRFEDIVPSARDRLFDSLLGAPVLGTSAVNAYTRREAIARSQAKHRIEPLSEESLDEHYRLAHLPGSVRPLRAFLRGRYERFLAETNLPESLPVWIGWGRQAVGDPIEDADLWLYRVPQAQLTVFERSASWPHVDQPGHATRELRRFFTAVEKRNPGKN